MYTRTWSLPSSGTTKTSWSSSRGVVVNDSTFWNKRNGLLYSSISGVSKLNYIRALCPGQWLIADKGMDWSVPICPSCLSRVARPLSVRCRPPEQTSWRICTLFVLLFEPTTSPSECPQMISNTLCVGTRTGSVMDEVRREVVSKRCQNTMRRKKDKKEANTRRLNLWRHEWSIWNEKI